MCIWCLLALSTLKKEKLVFTHFKKKNANYTSWQLNLKKRQIPVKIISVIPLSYYFLYVQPGSSSTPGSLECKKNDASRFIWGAFLSVFFFFFWSSWPKIGNFYQKLVAMTIEIVVWPMFGNFGRDDNSNCHRDQILVIFTKNWFWDMD